MIRYHTTPFPVATSTAPALVDAAKIAATAEQYRAELEHYVGSKLRALPLPPDPGPPPDDPMPALPDTRSMRSIEAKLALKEYSRALTRWQERNDAVRWFQRLLAKHEGK